jgi:uncharacterized protein involved in exopolysaccharide biosynthesis
MSTQPTPRDQLERAIAVIRRSPQFWRRALAVLILGVIIAVPYVLTRPRAYKSETVILYQETIRSADLTGGGSEGSPETVRRVGARLKESLMSRTSLEPIIIDLHLFATPGQKLDTDELVNAVDDMRRQITFRAREGDTFEISYTGTTAKEAQEVTRRLADLIVQEAANRRAQQATTLKEFLTNQANQNKTDLTAKEADLANWVALHPKMAARLQGLPPQAAAPGGAAAPPTDRVLAQLEARAFRIDRQLQKAGGTPPPPAPRPVFQPPAESAELVAARHDLADKQQRFTEKHPDVIAAKNRLKAAEQAQEAANQAALETFNTQQATAALNDPPAPRNATDEAALRKELADLQGQIAQRHAALAGVGVVDAGTAAGVTLTGADAALEVEFRRLQREVAEGRDRQHHLEDKLFNASITASSVMNDRNIQVMVLDPAYLPPAPLKPRTALFAALLGLCMVLAFITAIVSSALDDRIYEAIDIERMDGLPLLGVIPRAQLNRKDGHV